MIEFKPVRLEDKQIIERHTPCSPFVLKWMGRFSEGVSVPFVGYAGMMGVLGIVLIVVTGRKK